MIDWTIPGTITVGFVIVFVLGLLYKFLGQRTDPKLLELFAAQTKAASKRDEDGNKTNERLAEALDRNTETLDIVKTWLERAVNDFTQAIQQIVLTISTEHAQQFVAIEAIPGAIIPAINTLTQQLADQKGSVDEMNNTVEDQNSTIQQILAAVLRLESKIEIFQSENQRLGTEIREAKEELIAIKTDVKNLKPAKEAPGVPVTPKPNDKEEEKSE